jgi:hypothetical protein
LEAVKSDIAVDGKRGAPVQFSEFAVAAIGGKFSAAGKV